MVRCNRVCLKFVQPVSLPNQSLLQPLSFLGSLDPEQRERIRFSVEDDEWRM